MTEEKKCLRSKFKALRNSKDINERKCESEKIINILTELDEYKRATTVFSYVAFGSEVETEQLLNKAISDGKRLCVPLCDVQKKEMTAVEIDSLSQLKIGAYGIAEPPTNGKAVDLCHIDLIIVPALAFDKIGMRLGYGGGYYDKFLSNYKGCSIGLAFSCCMTESLPCDRFDCRVDMVITSERIEYGKRIY